MSVLPVSGAGGARGQTRGGRPKTIGQDALLRVDRVLFAVSQCKIHCRQQCREKIERLGQQIAVLMPRGGAAGWGKSAALPLHGARPDEDR